MHEWSSIRRTSARQSVAGVRMIMGDFSAALGRRTSRPSHGWDIATNSLSFCETLGSLIEAFGTGPGSRKENHGRQGQGAIQDRRRR